MYLLGLFFTMSYFNKHTANIQPSFYVPLPRYKEVKKTRAPLRKPSFQPGPVIPGNWGLNTDNSAFRTCLGFKEVQDQPEQLLRPYLKIKCKSRLGTQFLGRLFIQRIHNIPDSTSIWDQEGIFLLTETQYLKLKVLIALWPFN